VEKVRRLSRSVRVLTEQADTVEAELREERELSDRLAEDLVETRRALRSAVGSPYIGHAQHMTTTHIREVAARPLPGESAGTHSSAEEPTDG
jgi:hypothetical protein